MNYRVQQAAWYARHIFSWQPLIVFCFSAFGVMWTLIEILVFFGGESYAIKLKELWWVFLSLGGIVALWYNRPKWSVSCRLGSRDIHLEVKVDDIFAGDDSFVVGCNTSFDTDIASGIISARSVQGQFTSNYYTNVTHLDVDLTNALAGVVNTPAVLPKPGKQALYPIGTTVKVNPKGRTVYLCSIARMNAQGNAESTLDDIQRALPQLWEYIATAGNHGRISIPVLGSGFARVPSTCEELVREILKSFIAACSSQRPCEALTVVIHPKDFYSKNVDLHELGRYLAHLCKYTNFAAPNAPGLGQQIQP